MHKHCGCNCEPCRTATADAELTAERNRAYGRQRFVDPGPAREHVLALMAAGMGRPRISEISGIEQSIITRIVFGKTRNGQRERSRRITRGTEAALLAVTWNPADHGPAIDGTDTRRRLRALVAMGFYPAMLARELGYAHGYLDRIINDETRRVRPGTARKIHALYRRLADATPPKGPYAARAREQAAAAGWQPPLRLGGRVIAGTPLGESGAA
jgi:hypothetical protein